MKVRYEAFMFPHDMEPHYVKWVKRHWWGMWRMEMDGCHPQLYRKRGDLYIPF